VRPIEFGVDTREGFDKVIKDAIDGATEAKELSGGRTAYYDKETNTVVIVDPSSPDGGTAFKPSDGEKYFDGLR
jgi:filamentous hemagglutinin